jgi:hypothetical protein
MGGGIEGGSWPGNLPQHQSALISSALILLYPVAVSLEKLLNNYKPVYLPA